MRRLRWMMLSKRFKNLCQTGIGRQDEAGLSVSGVLGVLLRAKSNGTIQAIRPDIELLRSKIRFFITLSLEVKVLAVAGESAGRGIKRLIVID